MTASLLAHRIMLAQYSITSCQLYPERIILFHMKVLQLTFLCNFTMYDRHNKLAYLYVWHVLTL